jgi:hypothetical protein
VRSEEGRGETESGGKEVRNLASLRQDRASVMQTVSVSCQDEERMGWRPGETPVGRITSVLPLPRQIP